MLSYRDVKEVKESRPEQVIPKKEVLIDVRESPHERMETVIDRDTEIKGVINSTGVLRINGKVEGEIHHQGDLIIGESAVVVGQVVEAHSITVAGKVSGPLVAEAKIELVPTALVTGDVTTAALVIPEGAIFRGKCEMAGEERVESVAAKH